MINATAFGIILIILTPQIGIANEAPQIMIGFNCCHFNQIGSGTPVFMNGEEMWLKTTQNVTAILLNTRTEESARRTLLGYSSTRLYQFRKEDLPGLWHLEVINEKGNAVIPISLVNDQIKGNLTAVNFDLVEHQIAVAGTLSVEGLHQGGVLLLNHHDMTNAIATQPIPFQIGQLYASIIWDASNPKHLLIKPYAPGLTTPNVTMVWAEITSEIAFIKQADATQISTFIPQTVKRTAAVRINLQPQPQQSLNMTLPDFHQVDDTGDVPLRLGPINLKIFVNLDRTIYTINSDLIILPDRLMSKSTNQVEVAPLLNPVNFEIRDDLQQLSEYSLALIVKEDGVNVLWNQSLTPPVTKFIARNTLNNELISDYQISSGKIKKTTHVGVQTFAISTNPSNSANLTMTVGGIILREDEFKPNTVRLEPLSTVELRSAASTINLHITDAVGNTPNSGKLTIIRLQNVNNETLAKEWEAESKFALPPGEYDIKFAVGASTTSQHVSVSNPTTNVDLRMNNLLLPDSNGELTLSGLGVVILVAEVILAVRVWKSNLKRRAPFRQLEVNGKSLQVRGAQFLRGFLESPLRMDGIIAARLMHASQK